MMLNPALWYNTEFIALDKKAENDSIRSIIGVPKEQRYVKSNFNFFDAIMAEYKLALLSTGSLCHEQPEQIPKGF